MAVNGTPKSPKTPKSNNKVATPQSKKKGTPGKGTPKGVQKSPQTADVAPAMKKSQSPGSAKSNGTPQPKKIKTPVKAQTPPAPAKKDVKSPVPAKKDIKSPANKGKSPTPQGKKKTPVKAQTPPVPVKKNATPVGKKGKGKTPKSEPQAKTKKLKDEIDEELSDEDFENLLAEVAETEKLKQGGKLDFSKAEDDDEEASDVDEDMKSDDDDDDESDDDDDVEEDDESAEEEAPAPVKPAKKENGKAKKRPAEDPETSEKMKEIAKTTQDRQAERDVRSLFVKGMPAMTTEKEIEALSKDIIDVRLKVNFVKGSVTSVFAFLEFADEKTAEKNLPLLKQKTIKDKSFTVDFVGLKSGRHKSVLSKDEKDLKKLYITGFSEKCDEDALKNVFPKSSGVHIPKRSKNNRPVGYAFVFFDTEAAAKLAHDNVHNKALDGKKLSVLYAKKSAHQAGDVRKDPPKKEAVPAKKAKLELAVEAAPKKKKAKKVVVEEEEDDDEEDMEEGDDDSDDDDDDDDDESDD